MCWRDCGRRSPISCDILAETESSQYVRDWRNTLAIFRGPITTIMSVSALAEASKIGATNTSTGGRDARYRTLDWGLDAGHCIFDGAEESLGCGALEEYVRCRSTDVNRCISSFKTTIRDSTEGRVDGMVAQHWQIAPHKISCISLGCCVVGRSPLRVFIATAKSFRISAKGARAVNICISRLVNDETTI